MSDGKKAEYALGHSEDEIVRLERQGDYFRNLTSDLFVRAGLQEGMRVLDYGGGAGDVAMLAADIVGPSGSVLSFDRSAEAIAKATQRAANRGLKGIRFVQADQDTVSEIIGAERFDAVVGRLVLVFQRDPVAALRKVMSYVRPNGIVAFHEYDQEGGCWSQPRLPVFEQVFWWVIETFRQGGMVTNAGKLSRVFQDAGVKSKRIVREGEVADRAHQLAHLFMVDIMRTMLPLAEKLGVVKAEQVGMETLLARLIAESDNPEARWIPAFFVAAWGYVPD